MCYAAATFRPAENCLPNSVNASLSAVFTSSSICFFSASEVNTCGRLRFEELVETRFVGAHLLHLDGIEIAVAGGVDDRHLLLDRQRLILRLLQHFDQPAAAVQLTERLLVEVAAELRERRELAVLRQVQPQRTRDLAHGLDLRRPADARHRVADVDRGADALVKQIRLQEDLPVGDRNDVGRNVRREVAGLRLDDRQRRQRAAAELLAQLRRALQQSRVQIEDVAGIRLTARRPAQEQRDFAIGLRVLGEVVVDEQRVTSAVAEVLAHRARRIWADIEERRGIGCAGRDDDGVLHRAGVLERAHDLGDRRLLLPDRAVDADDVLALLVDDRVDRDGGLARLPVADDQLALASPDRHHRVDRLEPRLHRLLDRTPVDDTRREALDLAELLGGNRALAVDRLAERIDDASHQLFADRHRDDPVRPLDGVAFLDFLVVAQQHGADAFLFEVQGNAVHAVRKLEHLPGHRLFHAVHAGDAVAHRHDRANLGHVDVDGVAADLVADDSGDFFGFDVHVFSCQWLRRGSLSAFLHARGRLPPSRKLRRTAVALAEAGRAGRPAGAALSASRSYRPMFRVSARAAA